MYLIARFLHSTNIHTFGIFAHFVLFWFSLIINDFIYYNGWPAKIRECLTGNLAAKAVCRILISTIIIIYVLLDE